jgi:SAM-dependent methyltransferase
MGRLVVERDTCAVCDAERPLAHLFSKRGQSDATPYAIWQCLSCGFQRVRPMPDDRALAAYYAGGVGADYANYILAAEEKKAHFRQKLRDLDAYLPPPGLLLDVGCAAGFLLEVALEQGWEPHGVELNPGFAASTASTLDGRVTYGRLRDLPTHQEYSVITLFDVLEHTPIPREDLARCRDLLAPDGIIVAQLPCIDALARKALGRHWYHYAPPAHVNYFARDTFQKLAESLGLRIVHQAWTRKLMSIDYLLAQMAAHIGLGRAPVVPVIGKLRLQIPMSERLFVMSRS